MLLKPLHVPACITECFILFILIYCFSGACKPVAVMQASWVTCMKNYANAVRKPCIVCSWSWLLVSRAGLLTSTVNELYLSPRFSGFLLLSKTPSSIQELPLDEGIFTGKLCCSCSWLPASSAENIIHSHYLAGGVVTFYLNISVLNDGSSVNEKICIHCQYFQLERKMLLCTFLIKRKLTV